MHPLKCDPREQDEHPLGTRAADDPHQKCCEENEALAPPESIRLSMDGAPTTGPPGFGPLHTMLRLQQLPRHLFELRFCYLLWPHNLNRNGEKSVWPEG